MHVKEPTSTFYLEKGLTVIGVGTHRTGFLQVIIVATSTEASTTVELVDAVLDLLTLFSLNGHVQVPGVTDKLTVIALAFPENKVLL